MSACSTLGTIFSVLALLCTLLSAASPCWIDLKGYFFGLVYECVRGGGCNMRSREEILANENIITISCLGFAVILMVIGFLLTVLGTARHHKCNFRAGGCLFVIGGLSAVAANGIYAGFHLIHTRQYSEEWWRLFGYSFYFSFVGGVLGVVGGCMNACCARTILCSCKK